jgi:hypothetical protein
MRMRISATIIAAAGALGFGTAGAIAEDPVSTGAAAESQIAQGPAAADESTRAASAQHTENYLGVFAEPVGPALAAQLAAHLAEGAGVIVSEVLPDSPAALAGLQRFDVLVRFDGRQVADGEQLRSLIAQAVPDRDVALTIIRVAQPRTVNVTLRRRTVPADGRGHTGRRSLHSDAVEPSAARKSGSPAVPTKAESPASADSTPSGGRVQSISLSISHDRQLKLQARYVDPMGDSHEQNFEGPLDQLDNQTADWPAFLRNDVYRLFAQADALRGRKCTFQFRLKPQVVADQRSLRICIQRPDQAEAVSVFELEHPLDEQTEFDPEELLQIDGVAKELQELPPAIRRQIENTLRKIKVPAAEPAPERSL